MVWKLVLSAPLVFSVSAVPQALTSGPPPIKMGLWESTLSGPPGGGMKVRVCMTPDSYQNALARVPPGCTTSNVVRDRLHMSADVACTMHDTSSSGHIDVEFPDAEDTHMVMKLNMTVQGHSTAVTIRSDSHFVGPDCGGVAPGKPQIIR